MSLRERLAALPPGAQPADFRAAQLVFHGTGEPFSNDPTVAAFDRIFWTAETPAAAQAYIPVSGLSALISAPGSWRLDTKIVPHRHNIWSAIMRQMGHWPREVELDASGQAQSWTIDAGHPTYREAMAFLERMGWDLSSEPQWAAIRLVNGHEEVMPADWRLQGKVYALETDGLRIVDLRARLNTDLTDPAHLKIDLFRSIEASGADGIIIDDFAQCGRDHVNVPHVAIGLFKHVMAGRATLVYQATHCDLTQHPEGATTEFDAFRNALAERQP